MYRQGRRRSMMSTPEETLGKQKCEELTAAFKKLDIDDNGKLSSAEIAQLFRNVGTPLPKEKVKQLIEEVDTNKNGTIDINEFLQMMMYHQESKGASGDAFKGQRLAQAVEGTLVTAEKESGAKHSYSEAEVRAFSQYINENLAADPDCKKYLPLQGEDIFTKINDGVLLIKVINLSAPGTVDERVINKKPRNEFQMRENHDFALATAASLGCRIVNIGANDTMNGSPHLTLGLLWQVIRIGLVSQVNLQMHPGLAKLVDTENGETLKDLAALSPEDLLIKWVNYHLANAGTSKRIKNFTDDIKDSEAYIYLLDQIAPKEKKGEMASPHSVMTNPMLMERAETTLDSADKINCRKFVTPQDVVEGNYKLNLAFVANLFNQYPGLNEEEEETPPEEVITETREEKTFRNWINSLGLSTPAGFKPRWEARYLNNLYSGLADGLIILAIEDCIKPKLVDWSKICFPPFKTNRAEIQSRQNCKYAIDYAEKLQGVKLVAIGGNDIYDQRETLVLGLVWQLMRAYTKGMLDNLSSNDGSNQAAADVETFIISWVNAALEQKGKDTRINDFKDKSIQSSMPILDLIDSIREDTVDYSLVKTNTKDPEELLSNAKLAINWGRKIGAKIYALPEDVVEGKHKMVMTIFACLMERGLQNR